MVAAVGLAIALAPGDATARRLRCPAPFTASCLERLYRGFDAKGACTRDLSRFFNDGIVTDCWENGAYATVSGFGRSGGTSRLVDSRGRVVLEGVTSNGTLGGAIEVAYRRRKRSWSLARAAAGDWSITCPNRKTETFVAAEIAASTGCGPLAECAAGSCPSPQ